MDHLVGTDIGGCRIESKIGAGGMGAVYKARHLALDIPVAVKILTPLTAIDKARERFMREARIAAKLRHPNIVGVLNVGTERDIDFIVMEYIDGKNLREVLTARGALPREEAVRIALQVLDALAVAHKAGIVHRDIKPENIMLDAEGMVRLTDLGLARSSGDVTLTQSNVVLGSPLYVAPEQADNPSAADIRADIYALGCTLFHMLTGSPPFTGETPVQIILGHTSKPAPRLREINPAIPEPLDNAVYTMMQKSPAERYQTPQQAATALRTAMGWPQGSIVTPERSAAVPAVKKSGTSAWIAGLIVFAIIAGGTAALLLPRKKHPKAPVAVVADTRIDSVTLDTVLHHTVRSDSMPSPQRALKKPSHNPVKKTVLTSPPVPEAKKSPAVRDAVLSAVKTGDTQELLRLLNEGSSPNGAPGASTTPLHEAVRRGSTDQVRILVERGADPNIRDARGDTPLHYALRDDAQLIVRELLTHGADPNIKDSRGRTPLDIAASVSSSLESMVRQYGGR